METILDHNPTDAELKILYGRSNEDLKNAIRNGSNQDGAFGVIASLMALRGDEDAKERYMAKINDPEYRFGIQYSLSELS
jgi:hypothetical protein